MSGYALTGSSIEWIHRYIPKYGSILELGSGEGSAILAEEYNVHSIEHSKDWLNKFCFINYIYAPIKAHEKVEGFGHHQWYDASLVKEQLQGLTYDLIIVDGPPGHYGRSGFLKYFDLFKHDVPILFDDIHREPERRLINRVANKLNSPYVVYTGEKDWGVIWPNRKLEY